ncbi:MAG TPA: MBL fold metallo-hydrolase, partial [Anaerolineales bacterium]
MTLTYTWLGHGTSRLSIGGFSLVVDPFFVDNPAASMTVDQVAADFILVSHGHYDHVQDVEPLAKRTGALVISNPEIASWFAAKG